MEASTHISLVSELHQSKLHQVKITLYPEFTIQTIGTKALLGKIIRSLEIDSTLSANVVPHTNYQNDCGL